MMGNTINSIPDMNMINNKFVNISPFKNDNEKTIEL